MLLSISNISWNMSEDEIMYSSMKEIGFEGIEIAPTRIIPDKPYDNIAYSIEWAKEIYNRYGFTIPSMQSIWYGRSERLFGSEDERKTLIEYTMKAVDFAEAIGCGNLVFGCPRNRIVPDGVDVMSSVKFFRTIGNYAAAHRTVIAMEANPPIYNTNYINDTASAIELIENVESEGFKLNLDTGTMIENGESISILRGKEKFINHVHVSEPGLKPIQRRALHTELAEFLRETGYERFVSIEVGRQKYIGSLIDMMKYVKEIFG